MRCFVHPDSVTYLERGCEMDKTTETNGNDFARIRIIGVGGCGVNYVFRALKKTYDYQEALKAASGKTSEELLSKFGGLARLANQISYVVVNTDKKDLGKIKNNEVLYELIGEDSVISIGSDGNGAGANPEKGELLFRMAFEEDESLIDKLYIGREDLVIITYGLGGGTGTGGGPIIIQKILEKNPEAMLFPFVTEPFISDGPDRAKNALWGYDKLVQTKTKIARIKNDNLLKVAYEKYGIEVGKLKERQRLAISDDAVDQTIDVVVSLLSDTGEINLDIQDARAVAMQKGNDLVISIAEAQGDDRANKVGNAVINDPLYDGMKLENATGILVNIIGDPYGHEKDEIMKIISTIGPDAKTIPGFTPTKDDDPVLKVQAMIVGDFRAASEGVSGAKVYSIGSIDKTAADGDKTSVTAADQPPAETRTRRRNNDDLTLLLGHKNK